MAPSAWSRLSERLVGVESVPIVPRVAEETGRAIRRAANARTWGNRLKARTRPRSQHVRGYQRLIGIEDSASHTLPRREQRQVQPSLLLRSGWCSTGRTTPSQPPCRRKGRWQTCSGLSWVPRLADLASLAQETCLRLWSKAGLASGEKRAWCKCFAPLCEAIATSLQRGWPVRVYHLRSALRPNHPIDRRTNIPAIRRRQIAVQILSRIASVLHRRP